MILLINSSHKWWYKALSVLLVVALILAISFGAAPRVNAVGVLTMTVCAGILAFMAGAGIYTVVAGMSAGDIQSWLQGKLQEWDLYRNDGNIFTDLIEENLFVMTVKGILRIGNSAAQSISDFITWLVSDIGLNDNSNVQVESSNMYLGDIEGIFINSFSYRYVNYNWRCDFSHSVFAFYVNEGGPQLDIFSDSEFTVKKYRNSSLAGTYTSYYDDTLGLYCYFWEDGTGSYTNISPNNIPYNNISENNLRNYFRNNNLTLTGGNTLSLGSDVIGIPDVTQDENQDVYLGVDGVYPGSTVEEWTDVVMDGIVDNTLDSEMTISDEFVDAQEVVIVNEQAISVNTDHHMIGFTNLPDFVNLNLNSIWHYVSDAVEYASGFISWFVNLLSSVPTLAIPLYMSFTLLIVLSFIRRILL